MGAGFLQTSLSSLDGFPLTKQELKSINLNQLFQPGNITASMPIINWFDSRETSDPSCQLWSSTLPD